MSFAVISLLGTRLAWPFVGCFPHGSPSPRGVLPPQLARRERKPRPLGFSETCLAVGANQRGKTPEVGALSLGPAALGSVRSPLTPFPLTCPLFSCLDVQPGLLTWPHSPAQAHTVFLERPERLPCRQMHPCCFTRHSPNASSLFSVFYIGCSQSTML